MMRRVNAPWMALMSGQLFKIKRRGFSNIGRIFLWFCFFFSQKEMNSPQVKAFEFSFL
jgi:hypothetical protein